MLNGAHEAKSCMSKEADIENTFHKREEASTATVITKSAWYKAIDSLIDLLPVGVLVLDKHGYVRKSNELAHTLLNEPLLGISWISVIERDFSPQSDDGHEVSLLSGKRVKVATASLGATHGQLILLTDLSETRALQDKLNHQQRLIEMGKMTASLAHQIRTPLSSALLYARGLQKLEGFSDKQEIFIDKIIDQLYQLESQVKNMLNFSKKEKESFGWVLLEDLFLEVEKSFFDCSKNKTSDFLCFKIQEKPMIFCNKNLILGAICNLINNAMEAVCFSKEIIVSVERGQADEIIISVIDEGDGIDSERAKYIFNPFFSTKENGTGLGLSVVKAVIEQHEYEIFLKTKLGCGSRFSIIIPHQHNKRV